MSESGPARIAEAFARARADGRRAALMPYMMGGYPDMETSRAVGEALVAGGADLIELGVPFSDPLADGPVIHEAATTALAAGASLGAVVGLAAELARSVPVILMCYVNPILARGLERVCDELAAAGVSGLIVPDLPAGGGSPPRGRRAPRSASRSYRSSRRRRRTGGWRRSRPARREFIYAVSVTGTTGERGFRRVRCGGCRVPAPARGRAKCRSRSGSGSRRPSRRPPPPAPAPTA